MDWTPEDFFSAQKMLKRTMTIDKYRNDAVVVRTYKTNRKVVPPQDHRVKGAPSRTSLNKLVFKLNNSDVKMISMHTITIQQDIAKTVTPDDGKMLLHACLQRLRRQGGTAYVWVREFTKSGNPHWHIFSNFATTSDEEVDATVSVDWSKWFAKLLAVRLGYPSRHFLNFLRMSNGNGSDFLGCVRVERLRSDAAGRYAGKEGAKRFQKVAPDGWQLAGRWWGASRSVKCTPQRRVQVRASSLRSKEVRMKCGKIIDVPYRNQFGRGQSKEDFDK